MFMGGGVLGLLVIGALVYFLFNQSDHSRGSQIENDALETLKLRFAKEEISEEDYQQKKKILKGE